MAADAPKSSRRQQNAATTADADSTDTPARSNRNRSSANAPRRATTEGETSDGSAATTATAGTLAPNPVATAITAPNAPAASAPDASDNSGNTPPLAIAAGAIATATADSSAGQDPAQGGATMAEEVTAAANEVISTNFTIAKTIATSPSLSQAETNGVTPVMPQPAIAETAASAAPSLAAAISRPAGAPQRPLQPGRAADDASTVPPTDSAASPAADAAHAAKPSGPTHSASAAPEGARENDADGISLGSKTTSGHISAHLAAQPQTGADTPDFSASLAGSQLGPQTAPLTHTAAAQPMVTVAANHAVPIEGLAVQIALNAQGGRSRFEIRLDPAELGRIDVRLDVDRHGQVTSHLTVEKPETLALLRQDAPQLQRALEDAGLKTGSNGLQFSLRDQSFADRDQSGGSERQPHRLIISDTAPASASGSGRTVYPYAAASLSGGIDIRV